MLDSKDVASHCVLATTAPQPQLAWLHVGLLGWHCAKAADSLIISGYSPLRGLFVPNLIDATSYSVRDNPRPRPPAPCTVHRALCACARAVAGMYAHPCRILHPHQRGARSL